MMIPRTVKATPPIHLTIENCLSIAAKPAFIVSSTASNRLSTDWNCLSTAAKAGFSGQAPGRMLENRVVCAWRAASAR